MKEQPQLEVFELPTDQLVPYANNAKIHSALQVEQIANSIQEFGFNDPIAVWENEKGEPEIIEGHGRVLAAKKLGIDKLPVIYLNHLSDRARRAYTHIHNQTTLNSGFDIAILEEEMEKLNDLADFDDLERQMGEFDWDDYGFDSFVSVRQGGRFEPDDFSEYSERADEELPSFNVILSCIGEDEKEYVRDLLGEEGTLRRLYRVSELMQ